MESAATTAAVLASLMNQAGFADQTDQTLVLDVCMLILALWHTDS
jgi:hypothetical protein